MHYNGCNYLSMLGLKLNHVSKRGHWCVRIWDTTQTSIISAGTVLCANMILTYSVHNHATIAVLIGSRFNYELINCLWKGVGYHIVVLGYHKFSLQATIDHHGPSIYSGHYTTSVNCCNRTFYCNDNKITEFDMINTKNSSTAYVVIYKLIT